MFCRKSAHNASVATCAGIALICLLASAPVEAKITQIVIERTTSPAFDGTAFGSAGQYEVMAGRAYGELDPNDAHNAIITDIHLAPTNQRGMVEYEATFQITKPIDMSKASGLLWHDVPNRGRRLTIIPTEREFGDIGLSSGWQGDNSGRTVPGENNDYVIVPVARNPDGSPITGQVMGRIMNASGMDSQTIYVHSNPMPYEPASLDTSKASLTTHSAETRDGRIEGQASIAPSDWAFARCDAEHPFPGAPDARQICVKGGFDPNLLYQIVFTAQDPPVLGIGFAAFRDIGSFFKYAETDDMGTPNPIANKITHAISRGVSQSGNYIRQFLHQGFNEDEAGRKVHDGAWPIVAGRRIALNFRFAMPDGVLKLFEPGIEGTQSWGPSADPVRGIPTAGILDRCAASDTCPKVLEHFGAAEMWGMKVSPAFVGTAADKDIPLPSNVRRYYIGSTRHGGGPGGFNTELLPAPACPSIGWGVASLANNPMPHTETVNALRVHFRQWVMNDTLPPPSAYPTLASGQLVDPDKESLGFPTIPGLPANAPTGFINPMIDYDYG
ncbi:MAG: alpha/beta hydrolase domain-containing protein, partial [Micropepsaceae bacterium]